VAGGSSNLTYHSHCQSSSAYKGQSETPQSRGAVSQRPSGGVVSKLPIRWSSHRASNKPTVAEAKSPVPKSRESNSDQLKQFRKGWVPIHEGPHGPEMLQQGSLWVAGGGSNLTYHSPCQSSSALSGTVTDLPGCISQCFARCRMWS
jgi:hypothetical protein